MVFITKCGKVEMHDTHHWSTTVAGITREYTCKGQGEYSRGINPAKADSDERQREQGDGMVTVEEMEAELRTPNEIEWSQNER